MLVNNKRKKLENVGRPPPSPQKKHDTNVNELHFHYVFYRNKLVLKKMEIQFNVELINRIISRLLLDFFSFELIFIVTQQTKQSKTLFKHRDSFITLVFEYKKYIVNLNDQSLLIFRFMFPLSQPYSSLLSITKNLFRINKSIDYLLIGLIDHRSRFFNSSKYLSSQFNCLEKHFFFREKENIFYYIIYLIAR